MYFIQFTTLSAYGRNQPHQKQQLKANGAGSNCGGNGRDDVDNKIGI